MGRLVQIGWLACCCLPWFIGGILLIAFGAAFIERHSTESGSCTVSPVASWRCDSIDNGGNAAYRLEFPGSGVTFGGDERHCDVLHGAIRDTHIDCMRDGFRQFPATRLRQVPFECVHRGDDICFVGHDVEMPGEGIAMVGAGLVLFLGSFVCLVGIIGCAGSGEETAKPASSRTVSTDFAVAPTHFQRLGSRSNDDFARVAEAYKWGAFDDEASSLGFGFDPPSRFSSRTPSEAPGFSVPASPGFSVPASPGFSVPASPGFSVPATPLALSRSVSRGSFAGGPPCPDFLVPTLPPPPPQLPIVPPGLHRQPLPPNYPPPSTRNSPPASEPPTPMAQHLDWDSTSQPTPTASRPSFQLYGVSDALRPPPSCFPYDRPETWPWFQPPDGFQLPDEPPNESQPQTPTATSCPPPPSLPPPSTDFPPPTVPPPPPPPLA